jgi:hypothetical protein
MSLFSKTYVQVIISVLLLGLLAIYAQIRANRKSNSLEHDGRITTAIVRSANLLAKSGNSIALTYTYNVAGTEIRSESVIDGIFLGDFEDNFLYKSFPVIFHPNDPVRSEILITPDRFKRYDLPFPDSLKWVTKFWNKDYKRFD